VRNRTPVWLRLLAIIVMIGGLVSSAAASTTKIIYSFKGNGDGQYADTDLVADKAGNLYGTTVQGGIHGEGTVWVLSPSGNNWIHTALYSFTGGDDGGEPYKGVTLDAEGNIYGTAGIGGKSVGQCSERGCGVIFKLTKSGSAYNYAVIHYFIGGDDGYGPGTGVTLDDRGIVYGTTPTGGGFDLGVVYALIPNDSGNWTERIIHTFTGGVDGAGGSAARLLLRGSGTVFGLCTSGGAHGAGNVYELTPTATGEFKEIVLYAFRGEPDSGFPYGGIATDASNNLYGTTYYAGSNDLGTVYRLSRKNGAWTESALYSFKGDTDGDGPIGTLVMGSNGKLYGTTSEGGGACDCGTIFEVDPIAGTYSTQYRFTGFPDGALVYNGMTVGAGGNLYGATGHGGAANEGAIYEFTP